MPVKYSTMLNRGRNELIATDLTQIINPGILNGKVSKVLLSFFLFIPFCFFSGHSNAIFFDPAGSKHQYIGYDVPFWRWKASLAKNQLQVCLPLILVSTFSHSLPS
jgi:hypothetical protein